MLENILSFGNHYLLFYKIQRNKKIKKDNNCSNIYNKSVSVSIVTSNTDLRLKKKTL